MPSSLIFVGLVVLWLLILVPAAARHQQEVARPSVAALSGRVLDRPQRRYRMQEVDDVQDSEHEGVGATRVSEPVRIPVARPAPVDDDEQYDDYVDHVEYEYDDEGWERPAPRYRPGRGGFDPEAAAVTARARYVFRQRVVLGLLVTAVLSAIVALSAAPGSWWLHVAADLGLVGYLVYLRRQVRMEESIRHRRAARMAGTRRPAAADDPELDEWARRGQEVARRPGAGADLADADLAGDDLVGADDHDPDRVTGTGEPIGPLRVTGADQAETPGLPRLTPALPPPLPAGTTVVGEDLDDPALHDLAAPVRPDYRRAVGQ